MSRTDLREILAPYLAQWAWPGPVDSFMQKWFEEEDAVVLLCCDSTNCLA